MARILLIETSTAQLSAALAEDGAIVASRTSGESRMQAALTAPFIKEVLDQKGLSVKDLDAVCVGRGPGSYTGLRVGVSTAKGLCFGAGIPLLSSGSLDILVSEAHRLGAVPAGCRYIIPMVDARRMEVYSAVFTPDGRQRTETKPVIVDSGSFSDQLAEGPVLFIGDGVPVHREAISARLGDRAVFVPAFRGYLRPSAAGWIALNKGTETDYLGLQATYLRPPNAQKNKKLLEAMGHE